jgi:YVTN family beta-propeller protein/VCBS repeat-containing protein
MVTPKNASRLSGLTLAVGLGVAVSTGHGVASAEPSDTSGPSPKSSDSSSDSTSSAPSSASSTGNVTAHTSVGEDTEDKADTKTDTETDETTSEEPGTEKESEPTDEPTSPKGDDVNLGEPEVTTKHVETGVKSNDNPTRVAARPAPARDPESIARAAKVDPAETAQPLSLRSTVASADPQRFAVQALSATTALPAAPAAAPVPVPAPTVARTPVGPLTSLLALFGLQPAAPGAPVTPLSQLVELIWVAVRRIEHTFFNQGPRATTPTVIGHDLETGAITGKVGVVDPDPEDRLTYTVIDKPAHGTVAISADGVYTYKPDKDWAHATPGTDTFTVRVSDASNGFHLHLFSPTGDTVTVPITVQVAAINKAPTVTVTPTTPNQATGAITYTVVARDPENDAVTVTVSQPAHGAIVRNADGTYTYTPDRDFAHGLSTPGSAQAADLITFTATDRYNAATSVTVNASITPLNDAPEINAAVTGINTAGDVTIQLSVTDDNRDRVKITLPDPAHGSFTTLTVTDADGDTTTVTSPQPGLQLELSDTDVVTIVYRPDRVMGAPDSEDLTFVGNDGHGGAAVATVTATIAIPNRAPVITVGAPTVVNAATGAVRYPVTVSDPDGDPFTLTVSDPANGDIVHNADGSYTYTPDPTFAHSLSLGGHTDPAADAINFVAADQLGATAITVVFASITPQNTAPYRYATSVAGDPDADGTVTGRVFVRDNENDGITYAITSTKGTVTIDNNGNFTFDPSTLARQQAAAIGASTEDKQAIVVITANDGHGGQLRLEVTVDVLPATGNTITFADGARPYEVFVPSNDATKIYVWTGPQLRIVDTTTRTVVGTIDFAGNPSAMVMSQDGRYVYFAKTTTGTEFGPVTKVDLQTGDQTPIQGVVRQPSAMAISANGATLYVTNRIDGTVSVINTATGAFYTIDTGLQSDAIAVIDKNGDGVDDTLYVGSLINDVRVVNIAAGTYTVLPTGPYDGHSAATQRITVAGRYVYVTDTLNDKVAVIDSNDNTVVARVNVGDNPSSIAVSPGGAFVFVANAGSDSVSVIDSDTGTVATTIPVGDNPTNVDVSKDGLRLYVSTRTGILNIPIADIYYLFGGGNDDGPGWAVGAGTGTGTGTDPSVPPGTGGGGLGGGGTGPVVPPIIPGGPGPIRPPGEIRA